MENILTSAELKRRGIAAIEDGLRRGPIRIVKHNQSAAVVLSEDEYQRLRAAQGDEIPGMTAMQWLLAHSGSGQHGKPEIDRRLRDERSW